MSEYVIVTDSSGDMNAEMVQQLGVEVLPLSLTVRGTTFHNYPDDREMDPKEFYRMLRAGEPATTAAVNVHDYTSFLTPVLESGKDVLILAFSSGLSATYQSSCIAAEELRAKFPGRTVEVVDTLCASLGQGLIVFLAAQRKLRGESLAEVRDWVLENRLHLCHWFTVDDLHFLKRGGRVSAATAVVGSMLHIKPVMHVDNEGHLINMAKARGRAASLTALVDHMEATAIEPATTPVFISHGDCLEDAQKVADDIRRRFGTQDIRINNIGPVIGAHAGPGCVALFFVGTER